MKKLVAITILACACLLSQSQVLTVKDLTDHHPLQGVVISSLMAGITVETNALGQADLSPLGSPTPATITLLLDGYRAIEISYDLLISSGFQVLLEQSAIRSDPSVISGTRWSQPASELPSRVTAITSRQSAFMNPQTTADMLASQGDVFVQKNQLGGGSLMIRGFSSNSIVMEVDGIRMNTAISCSGNQQNLIAIDPFAIRSAEILFGPSSVVYGSNAIGGVVSLNTVKPKYSLKEGMNVSGDAAVRYSSADNEMTGHAGVSLGWKKWASYTSFTFSDFGDLRMGSYGPEEYKRPSYVETENGTDVIVQNENPQVQVPSGYSQANLVQKIRYNAGPDWDFQYSFYLSTTSEIPWYDALTKTDNGTPVNAEAYYGPQTWMMNALAIDYNCTGSICDRLQVQAAHQFIRENRTDRGFNDPVRHYRQETINAIDVSFNLVKQLRENHQLFYGLDVLFNDVSSAGHDENILSGEMAYGPGCFPESQWGSYGLYLDYLGKVSRKVSLHAGFRYNIYSLDADFDSTYYHFPVNAASINNDALTGNLGVVYSPNEKWSLSTNLSTGFRAPDVDDAGRVIESEPGSVLLPNPGIKAEYSYNIDTRVEKTFGDYLKVDVSFYYTFLKDAMVRNTLVSFETDSMPAFYGATRMQTTQNLARAQVYGIQAGLKAELPYGLGVTAIFNYQEGTGRVEDGQAYVLDNIAPCFGQAGLSYSINRLEIELSARYSGQVRYENLPAEERERSYLYATDSNGDPYSPAWCILDIRAAYQLTGFLSISAGAENLTDARYRPYSWGITAPGRNFIIALRATF